MEEPAPTVEAPKPPTEGGWGAVELEEPLFLLHFVCFGSCVMSGERLPDGDVDQIFKLTGIEEDLDGNIKYEGWYVARSVSISVYTMSQKTGQKLTDFHSHTPTVHRVLMNSVL